MIRGDVYQADLDPTQDSEQAGINVVDSPAIGCRIVVDNRPVLIVSRDGINRSSPVVVIVPITKFTPNKRIYPSQCLVKADSKNGLTQDSIVKCEQIRAIAKSRLSRKWGSLKRVNMNEVEKALKIVLSLK